jgi:hypothetical protein
MILIILTIAILIIACAIMSVNNNKKNTNITLSCAMLCNKKNICKQIINKLK